MTGSRDLEHERIRAAVDFFKHRFGQEKGFRRMKPPQSPLVSMLPVAARFVVGRDRIIDVTFLRNESLNRHLPRLLERRERKKGGIHVLLLDYVTTAELGLLEKHNLNYLDLAGNARINEFPFYIEVAGRSNTIPVGRKRETTSGHSGRVLNLLAKSEDPLTRPKIARKLMLSRTHAYGIVSQLIDDGMVEVSEGGEVSLTSAGRAMIPTMGNSKGRPNPSL